MNLLEYVQTLSSDISIAEKIALTKAWKDKNEGPIEEEVKPNKFNEDGSLNVDSFSEETKGAAEKVNEKKKTAAAQDNATAMPVGSESSDSGSGTLYSIFNEETITKQSLDFINRQVERSIAVDAQRALKSSRITFQDDYEVFDPYGTGEAGEIGLEDRKSTLGIVKTKPESKDDKLIRDFKEASDLQKPQFDSLYAEIYNNEDLFTPVETQKLIEGSTGSGMDIKMGLMTPSLQETITIIPNEKELKTALKQLESKPRKIGAPKISKQEIETRAKQNMFNSKARDIKMNNARSFIEKIPKKDRTEKQNLIADYIVKKRNRATWDVEDFGKELELDLSEFKDTSLVSNFKSYSKSLKEKQKSIKDLQSIISKKQKQGKPVVDDLLKYKNLANNYKEFVNYYNSQGVNLRNERLDLENRIVEYSDMISSIEDSDVQLDALKRVYNKFEKRYTDLTLGAYGIFINSAAYLEKASNFMSVETLEVNDEGNVVGSKSVGSTFFQDKAKALTEVKEFASEKYYKPISFDKAFDSLENFAEYGIDQAVAQAPIFAAIASGNLGMLAVSASSAGEYQAGRQLEGERVGGRKYDESKVFLQSLGFGAAEYAFGVAPTSFILAGTYRSASSSGKRQILNGWKNYFRTIKKDGPLDLGLAMVDAAGEGLTTISQNGIDGKPLFENVSESVFTGGLFGSLTASASYFKGAFSAALSDYKTNADYRENLKMINILDRSTNNPWITEADKAEIEKSKQDLIDQNNEIVEQRVNLATNNLNKQGGELLQQSMKRQEELRNQAEALDNNNSIPNDQKASILNALEAEFNQIEAGADKFKKAFTNTFGLLSNKEQSRLKTEAERLLKVDGDKNVSGDKIARKAEQIHTKEKLEQTLQSDQATLKALASSGIEVGYSVEDTNAGAIKSFTAMMNFRAADKNNSITQEQADSLIKEFTEGINDGTLNGFNVPSTNIKTGKKVYDSITSVQNSVANERSQTSLHELGHVITTEALGSDPAAFEETKNLILSYLETANPEAYTRITTRTKGQSADEVLMVFFEEVADNKIKLDKAKGSGFLGYLGSMLGTAASKASNTDYNYNFKGETDIINFVKELGRKLKDGTLTVEDVKTIQQEGLAGQQEAPVISLDKNITSEAASRSSKESQVEASTKVQEIYDTQGEAGALDIIEQFKPIVSRIVEKRSEAPNFDRQLLTDEIETGKRGIFDLIKEYKPESGVPLAAYINKFLPARAIEASQRVLGEEFTSDVTEAKNVMAEEIEAEIAAKPAIRKIKPSSLISNDAVSRIKEQVQEKIEGIDPKNLTFKKLGNLAPEIIAAEIGIPVKKLTVPAANLSKGDATAIQQFVNKNADKLLKILPQGAVVEAATEKLLGTSTGVPKGLLDAFYTKKARLSKGAGLAPFVLNKGINKAQFLEAFGIVDGKKQKGFDTKSPQAQALKGIASLYGKLVTNEIVRSDTDLSLEAKQDVAAGKNVSMASKEVRAEDLKIDANKSSRKITGGLLSNNTIKQLNEKGYKTIADIKNNPNIGLTLKSARKQGSKNVPADTSKLIKQSGYRVLSAPETAIEINAFLKDFPKYREVFRSSTTNSLERSLMGAKPVFDRFIPKSDTVYDYVNRDVYKGTSRSKPDYKKLTKSFVEKTKSPDFLKDQYAKLKYFENFWTDVQSYLSNFNGDEKIKKAALFDELLTDAQSDMGSLMRISPPILYLPLNSRGLIDLDVEIREEHNFPQNQVGSMLLQAAINGNVDQAFKLVSAAYMQGPVTMKDDGMIDVDFKTGMPDFFWEVMAPRILSGDLIIPEGSAAVIRLSEAGVNLDKYQFLPENKTFSEYFFGTNGLPTNVQNQLLKDFFSGKTSLKQTRAEGAAYSKLAPGMRQASRENNNTLPESIKYDKDITVPQSINALAKTDKALNNARKLNAPIKKIRVFDFDDTLAKSKSMVIVNMPNGSTNQINATQFAQQAADLESQGAEFDFTEFSKVVEGKKGPLFSVAQKIADARGTEDVFILTARPQAAAGPIKAFMEANGIDIPLKNITGLGDGAAQAKAGWIMGKAADGYNDFYFADDAAKNVKAVKDVLSQVDVKSKVQLAKASKEKTFDTIINDMIEDSSGIEAYKQYSAARAKTIGANKGRFDFFIPPSAEDFTGLLYKMLGKGKKGDAQMAFLKTNLLDPYDRAEAAVTQAKIAAANDFKALKTNLKTLPTSLSKPTGIGGFTFSHAVRVSVWSKQGMNIPGLSKRDIKELNDFVDNNAELSVFTDELMKIQKGKPYPKPGDNWLGGNITSDIINDINKVNRAEYQQEWRENVDIIFSETNMNKMEAAYGTRWRKAMEDSLRRMKSGSNRPPGGNSVTDGILDWLNNSVGAVMFLNTRSALLQTISAVNFINWGDNNIVKAGVAFANQKQFWSDFMTLMNSDYLVERREGLKINVSESEIADAVRDSKNKVKSAIAFLLSKGFVMTRFADSFAIATGGSTFYRNRIKALLAKGMDQKAAEAQAFFDFRQIAEESQQSSNPNRISQQQASGAGRVILAWANTPMQYTRIQKRDIQDLINRRGDWKTKVSRIVYYGAVQNLIFNALQQAVFALGFGEDDEEEQDAKKSEKISRIANGMIDSQLKGLGIGGAAVVAVKNALMELGKQHAKDRPAYEEAVFDLLGFSPPLGSKIQKINGGLRSFSWNMKDIKDKGFSLDNPAYLAGAQITTGLTNIPLDRVIKKINSMRGIVSEQSALWQKVALGLGWSTWDVGLGYYGGFDAARVLTPEEEKVKEIDDMKKLTKTKEQIDMLLDLGLTKKEIKDLGKEQSRVEKIIELQNAEAKPKEEAKVKEEIKEETKPEPKAEPKVKAKPKTESAEKRLRRQFDSIKDENKPDQVKTLLKFGLTKKEIRDLQYEKNRVEKILELMPKNK